MNILKTQKTKKLKIYLTGRPLFKSVWENISCGIVKEGVEKIKIIKISTSENNQDKTYFKECFAIIPRKSKMGEWKLKLLNHQINNFNWITDSIKKGKEI